MSGVRGARVCLVTSGPVGSDPRLVKEATALDQAGAQVRVVAVNATRLAHVHARDAQVLAGVRWRVDAVEPGGWLDRKARAVARRLARLLWQTGLRGERLACVALEPLIPRIAAVAARERADLYIAHNLPALPAAAMAARRHGARLGFDAEDFHSGQLHTHEQPARALFESIERRYLPRCGHLSAASPGIAAAYADACDVPAPVVVLNVFPRAQAPSAPTASGERADGPSLYWFSQTIGPGRGLEAVIAAIGRSRSRPRLVLQGFAQPPYQRVLQATAARHGVADRLHFLPPAAPAELARIASRHDIGLATEEADTVNHDICLSNKIFTYLLGGVPVLASVTSAQAALARQQPDCIWAIALPDTTAWAARLDALLLDPQALAHARARAWQCAQDTYHWEHQAGVFLDAVAASLARPPKESPP